MQPLFLLQGIMPINLLDYRKDIYSQAGQDGIIEYIFNVLGIQKGHFVEFGAGDGVYWSNCRKLFDEGWSGVFIECDRKKFSELKRNYFNNKHVLCINNKVEIKGQNNFDRIMSKYAVDKPITFLSIDVDGIDLEIFETIEKNLPLVVCIEGGQGAYPFDPRMPPYCTVNIGQSLNVIHNVAKKKGYEIICTFQDTFLIQKHLLCNFNVSPNLFELYLSGLQAQKYNILELTRRLRGFHRGNRILDYILKETNYSSNITDEEWLKKNEQKISNIIHSLPSFLYNAQTKNYEKIMICMINYPNLLREIISKAHFFQQTIINEKKRI